MAGVIADTSVWIQNFRFGDSSEALELDRMLEAGEVFMVGIVYAELLRGARTQSQSRLLESDLYGLPFLEMTRETWRATGHLMASLQLQGLSVALPDVAIAAIALENDVPVFTRDRHFERIQGLKLHKIE
jgi:predicted nucleic acid-binding protein